MIGVASLGIRLIPNVEIFLDDRVVYRPFLHGRDITAIAGWGAKPRAVKAMAVAKRRNLPYLALEDGFLRSLAPGSMKSRRLSMVVDRTGIYYNASQPSDLENLLNTRGWERPELIERAKSAIERIIKLRLSKYNHAPDAPESLFPASKRKKVLIIDQTRGDSAIHLGMSSEKSFFDMLVAARRENPDAALYIKIHPEVLAGKKRGHLEKVAPGYEARIIPSDYSPWSVIEKMDKVYTVTSQMGFEALLLGKEVRCFGMPFFAGWGQTCDELEIHRRKERRSIEEIFAAAYILYSRYVDPYSGRQCSIEDAIDILATLRRRNNLWRGLSVCTGFSWWKRPHVKAFLSSTAGEVRFMDDHLSAVQCAGGQGGRVVVWASKEQKELSERAAGNGVQLVRMEDGFLRSVGLGSDFHLPYSLVLDETGIYYDPSRPSDLEVLIERGEFNDRLLARARRLREEIVQKGITKYNTGSQHNGELNLSHDRKIVLVPGQVENDASVLLGSPDIRTNLDLLKAVRQANPDAFLIYKPHPEIEAGNRPGRVPEDVASRCCDMIVSNVSIGALIPRVDELHTITSLAGFEALLRGKKVCTYGGPFYAGWGLTVDHLSFPRRTRKATLDELVAAALILYPSYYDWKTHMFCGPEVVLQRLCNETGTGIPTRRFMTRPFLRFAAMLLTTFHQQLRQ